MKVRTHPLAVLFAISEIIVVIFLYSTVVSIFLKGRHY